MNLIKALNTARAMQAGEYIPSNEEAKRAFEVVPCPFCKEDDYQVFDREHGTIYIECNNCRARGPDELTYQYAVNAWNKSDPCIGQPCNKRADSDN